MSVKSLLVTLALGLGCSTALPETPTAEAGVSQMNKVRNEQLRVIQAMAVGPVEVSVHWEDCGFINAFYNPWEREIILCNESIRDNADHAIEQAAHEMGHALVLQLNLPIDSDPKASERAADELAAIALIQLGMDDVLQGAGMWWAQQPNEFIPASDPHPDSDFRGWEMLCLQDGSEDGTPECQALYHAVSMRWMAEIAIALLLLDAGTVE